MEDNENQEELDSYLKNMLSPKVIQLSFINFPELK